MITDSSIPEGRGWSAMPHDTARDRKLSYKALGLLVELLSYPPGWETNIDKLYAINKASGGFREGRDAMRAGMQELERAGYVTRKKNRLLDGTFETVVTARNYTVAADRRTGYQASVYQASDNQSSADQSSVSQASLETLATNTESKTERELFSQHSTSLAEARAAAADAAARRLLAAKLQRMYDDVDAMTPNDRRNRLLKFERKRGRIYRDCRRKAIAQFEREKPQIFSQEWAAEQTDRLSFKYALRHYMPEPPRIDWPAWIVPARRLDEAA